MADNISSLFTPPAPYDPPQVNVDFYRMLSGIGDTLQQARDKAPQRAFQEALKNAPRLPDGSVDPKVLAGIAAQSGYPQGVSDYTTLAGGAETRQLAQRKFDEDVRRADPAYIQQAAVAGETPEARALKRAQAASLYATAEKKDTPQVIETYDETTGQPRKQLLYPGGRAAPIGGIKQGGDKDLTGADRKAIFESEDENAKFKGTIDTLKYALELNPKTFTGYGAGVRGELATKLPIGGGLFGDKAAAEATAEWNRVMSAEAVKNMSSTLKGATTDRELFEFQRILSDPATTPAIRQRTIERMLQLAERQAEVNTKRMEQIRGRTYYRPGGGVDAVQPQSVPSPTAPAMKDRMGGAPAPRSDVPTEPVGKFNTQRDAEMAVRKGRLQAGDTFIDADGTTRVVSPEFVARVRGRQ